MNQSLVSSEVSSYAGLVKNIDGASDSTKQAAATARRAWHVRNRWVGRSVLVGMFARMYAGHPKPDPPC